MKTQYLVLPYKLGARNKVEAQQAQACRSDADALRTGERMARRFLGIVVIAQDYDEQGFQRGRPAVLAIYGTVPEGWLAAERTAA